MKLKLIYVNYQFPVYFSNLKYTICLHLLQLILLCTQYSLVNAKPFIGHNIRQAHINEFPYVVFFGELVQNIPPENRIWCTGTLVTLNHILTAEHCFNDQGSVPFLIMAESHELTHCRYYRPCWWISYNQWMVIEGLQFQYGKNDLLILKVINSVSTHITPAPLLVDAVNTRLYEQNVTLVGWGDNGDQRTPSVMQAVKVKVLTKTECDTISSTVGGLRVVLHSRFLCTKSEPFVHLSEGDSGGPLLYRGGIAAISTGIFPCNEQVSLSDKVNIHLDVYYYRNFIYLLMNV